MIELPVLAQGCDSAEQDPEERTDNSRDQDQCSGVDQARLNQAPDRLVVKKRAAKVAGEHPGQPCPVLVSQGAVQVQLKFQRMQQSRPAVPAEYGYRCAARQDLRGQEYDYGHQEQREDTE